MPNLDHLSYSSVSSYLLCGRSWAYRYIEKAPAPTAPALVFGSAWHDAVETYVTRGGDPSALWMESWAKRLQTEQNLDWGAESPDDAAQDGARMMAAKPVIALLETLRAGYNPEKCVTETRVELGVPGVPIPVVGYIDYIGQDGVPCDFKTAARMWTEDKAQEEMQPLFYLAALNQQGRNDHGWRFRHYVFSKTQKPDAKVFEVTRRPSEAFWLFEMIQGAWKGIEAGVYPMVPSTWKCNPKYCEYWPLCRGRYA